MRRPFSTQEALNCGISPSALRWGIATGKWQRVCQGVYIEGLAPPTPTERAIAFVVATGGVASHSLAGVMHEFDSVRLKPPFVSVAKRARSTRLGVMCRELPVESIVDVNGIRCTDGLQTVLDLAAVLDDVTWEQVLECALRKRMTKVSEIEAVLPELGRSRIGGVSRIRHVLSLRPANAKPTESLLETLMVQLIRKNSELPEPERQVEISNRYGLFVARVDLAWSNHGVFLELDGQHHKNQPVYDARRETAAVAATGWLPGRFTWTEVTRHPNATRRHLMELLDAARRLRHR